VLGLVLVGVALFVTLPSRADRRLEVSWFLVEAPAAGGGAARVEGVRPGGAYRLVVSLRPGPDAPEGSSLVCGSGSRPRISVGAADHLVFENAAGFLHTPDDSVPLDFTVREDAPPGPVGLVIRAEAELAAKRGVRARGAVLVQAVTVTVTGGG
jgi:hypothetical protein